MAFLIDFETGDTSQVTFEQGLSLNDTSLMSDTYCAVFNNVEKYANIEFDSTLEKVIQFKMFIPSTTNFGADYDSAYFSQITNGNQLYDAGWSLFIRRYGSSVINAFGILKSDFSIVDTVTTGMVKDTVLDCEIDYKSGSGDGHFIFKVQGVTVFNYTGLSNASEPITCFHFGLTSGNALDNENVFFDDITDDIGGAQVPVETDYDTSILITKTLSQQKDYDTSTVISKTIAQQKDYDSSTIITKTLPQHKDYDTSTIVSKTIAQQKDYDSSTVITKTIAQVKDYDTGIEINKTISIETDYDTSIAVTKTIALQTDYDTSILVSKTITYQRDYDTSIEITKEEVLVTDYDTSILITKTILHQKDYDSAVLITKTIVLSRDYDTSILITKLSFNPDEVDPARITAAIGYNNAVSDINYNRAGASSNKTGATSDVKYNNATATLEVNL